MICTQPFVLAAISLVLVLCYVSTVVAYEDFTTLQPSDADLEETTDENIPHPEALVVDGSHGYRMPGLFGMDGKPFYLEKDPITGAVDFSAGTGSEEEGDEQLKTAGSQSTSQQAEVSASLQRKPSAVVVTPSAVGDDYYYDDEELAMESENIERKDSVGSGRPNDLNPYQLFPPDFHEFLNIPIHDYNNGTPDSQNVVHDKFYPDEKFPLISSSYANTKVQGTGNNKVRPPTSTTRSPSYYTFRQPYSTTALPESFNGNQQPYRRQESQSSTHYPPVHYGDFRKPSADSSNTPLRHPDDDIIYDYYDDVSDTGFGLKTSAQSEDSEEEEDQFPPARPDRFSSHTYPSKVQDKVPPKTNKPVLPSSTAHPASNPYKEHTTRASVPNRASSYVTNKPTEPNRYTNPPSYTSRQPVQLGQPANQPGNRSPAQHNQGGSQSGAGNRSPAQHSQGGSQSGAGNRPPAQHSQGGSQPGAGNRPPAQHSQGGSQPGAGNRPPAQHSQGGSQPGAGNRQPSPVTSPTHRPSQAPAKYSTPISPIKPFSVNGNGPYNYDEPFRPIFGPGEENGKQRPQGPYANSGSRPTADSTPIKFKPDSDNNFFGPPVFTGPPFKEKFTGTQETPVRQTPPSSPQFFNLHPERNSNIPSSPPKNPAQPPYGENSGRPTHIQDRPTNFNRPTTSPPPKRTSNGDKPSLQGRPPYHDDNSQNRRKTPFSDERSTNRPLPTTDRPQKPSVRPSHIGSVYQQGNTPRPHTVSERPGLANSGRPQYSQGPPPPPPPPPGPPKQPYHRPPQNRPHSEEDEYPKLRPPFNRPLPGPIRPDFEHPGTLMNSGSHPQGVLIARPNGNNIPPPLREKNHVLPPRPRPQFSDGRIPPHLQRPDAPPMNAPPRPRPGQDGPILKPEAGRLPQDLHYRPLGAPPKTSHPGQRVPPPPGRLPYNSLPHYANRPKPGQEAHAAANAPKKPGIKYPDPNLPNILPQFRPNANVEEKHFSHGLANRHPVGLERHDNVRRPYYDRMPPPPPHLRLRIHRTQAPEDDYSYGAPPRFSHPPGPLVGRRTGPQNGPDAEESRQVATLQMMQSSAFTRGGSRGEAGTGIRPPFEVRPASYGSRPVDAAGSENRPVFVVYPVNAGQRNPSPVEGDASDNRGSQGPSVQAGDDIRRQDTQPGFSSPNLRRPGESLARFPQQENAGGNIPQPEPPRKSDFPYALERPSMLDANLGSNEPQQEAQEKSDSIDASEEEYVEETEDDSDFNIIPYLQDYLPFGTKKPSTRRPYTPTTPSSSSNTEQNNVPHLPPGHRRPPPPVPGSVPPQDVEYNPLKGYVNIRPPQPLVQRPDAGIKTQQTLSTTLKTTYSPSSSPSPTTPKTSDQTPFRITEHPKPTPLIITERLPSNRPQGSSGTEITLSAVMHAHGGGDNHRISDTEGKGTVSATSVGMSFQAPFYASANVAPSPGGGWSAVGTSSGKERMKPGIVDRAEVTDRDGSDSDGPSPKFDFENFKPQLFGGFKPIYSFPEDENPEKQSRGREEKKLV